MSFHYEKDSNQVVTVTMDMDGPVNSMSDAFLPLFEATLDKLEAETELAGVVLTSGKSTFFAGGDLNMLCEVTEETVEDFFQRNVRNQGGYAPFGKAARAGLRGYKWCCFGRWPRTGAVMSPSYCLEPPERSAWLP